MPEANTSQILLDEILQKLQASAPVSVDELLKMFLGDRELEQIRSNTLNKIRKISNDTLDFVVTSLQKELFNNPKKIAEMADPLGFIELRKTYKNKSEKIFEDSLDNIKNEFNKIKINDLNLFEDLKKKIDAIELPENIKTIDVPVPAPSPVSTPVINETKTENKLDKEVKDTFTKIEKTLNKLNKSLKSIISKKTIEPEKKIIFSEKALNQLSRVTNIDRELLENLKQKIESDPTKKTLTTITKKNNLLGRTIYEAGDPKVQLNESSLKNIFQSLDITNDQQEIILTALLDITKDTNKDLKETKKGILESSFFKILNGIADFLRDLLAIGTLFLGGAGLIQIAKWFGPEILNFIDKYFGTDLTKAFENVTSKFENFSNVVNTIQKWLLAFGAGLVTVSGLLLYGFSGAIKNVISSLGKFLFKPGAFSTPKPAKISPTTKPPKIAPTPSSSLPPGAKPAGTSSYIGADGKAYSSKTGKPLTGAAAKSALQAANKISPPTISAPSTGAKASTTGAQWAKGILSKGSIVLAAGIETVNSYQTYQTYASQVDDALKNGEINEYEASELKTKAKGRITGEATARTVSGLVGAALTAGAVGAGIGAAGLGVGAIPGFLIGLGAGAIGYYGGSKLSEATGITELAGKAGEETAMFYSKPDKPDLKVVPEPQSVNVEKVEQFSQFPMQQILDQQNQNQTFLQDMMNNFNQNILNMNQNLQGMSGGFNNINVNQNEASDKNSALFINSSRMTDPILDFRADWWNHISKRGVY
jgi:hypothetical protein